MGVNMKIKTTHIQQQVRSLGLALLFLFTGLGLKAIELDSTLLAKMNLGGKAPFEITYVVSDARIPGYLNVNIRALLKDTIVSYEYLEDSLRIKEAVGGEITDLDIQKVSEQQFDMITIIVDVSSSMWKPTGKGGYWVDSALTICDSVLNTMEANYMVNLFTFDEKLYGISPDSLDYVKRPVKARYTHLYECIDAALGRMSEAQGRKLLIVIGDGENDHNRNTPVTVTQEDLMSKIAALDSSYYILPVAMGPSIYRQNLTQIIQSTPQVGDSVSTGTPGDGFWNEVESLKEWEWTHTILMKSNTFPHIGENRTVYVELGADGYAVMDSTNYSLGQLYDPWNEQANWQLWYFLGGLLAFLIFILFAFIVPWRRWVDFNKKYVKYYWQVKEEGIQRHDPLTKFPFRDDDKVVVRCEHMQSLETWQYEGRKGKDGDTSNRKRQGQCLYYPQKCDAGTGPSGIIDFFNQAGFYKYLMWVFFGILGGYLGWTIWALFKEWDFSFVNRWFEGWALRPEITENIYSPPGASAEDATRIVSETAISPWFYQSLLGFVVAFIMTVCIAIAMEAAQAKGGLKGNHIAWVILRVLARGLAAGILTALVFVGFGLTQYFVMPDAPYLPGLLALLFMGIIVGRALTTATGIRNVRGFLAGLAGGFVAFHIYYVPVLLFNWRSFEGPKLTAFMAMGGLIAYLLSKASPALEASELDIYTGRKRYGTAFVTDLLRKNEDVIIGRGPTATIRLKMRYTPQMNAPGNVTQPFARLVLRNEVVYLVPEIFTEVNGDPIAPNEKVPLIDGDRITFEHTSPSHLRYREFRTGPHPRRRRRRGRKAKQKRELPRKVVQKPTTEA